MISGETPFPFDAAAMQRVPHVDVYSPVHQLDMDRTTLRTQDTVEVLFDAAATFDVAPNVIASIRDKQKQCEADGGSFDPLSDFQAALPPAQYDAFGDYFMKSGNGLAYSDTPELFDQLRPADGAYQPHFYGTYGTNPVLQGVKVPLTGLAAWTVLMPNSNKGTYAGQIQTERHATNMAGLDEAGDLVAVYHCHAGIETTDDKSKSHKNTPENSKGNMLLRLDEERLPSQGTAVPEGYEDRVRTIHSLGEVTVGHDMELASCSHAPLPDTPLQPAAFRPMSDRTGYPGLYIARTMPFSLLRQRIEAMQ